MADNCFYQLSEVMTNYLDDLILHIDRGAEVVVGVPLLRERHAMILELVLGLQAARDLKFEKSI